jgi:hypothetical protein
VAATVGYIGLTGRSRSSRVKAGHDLVRSGDPGVHPSLRGPSARSRAGADLRPRRRSPPHRFIFATAAGSHGSRFRASRRSATWDGRGGRDDPRSSRSSALSAS